MHLWLSEQANFLEFHYVIFGLLISLYGKKLKIHNCEWDTQQKILAFRG